VIHNAIRAERIRRGLTQVQAAEQLGVTPTAWRLWEWGKRTPTGLYAKAVEAWLGEKTTNSLDSANPME
jgi:transcriptional regulator with XRE-family HTH domain